MTHPAGGASAPDLERLSDILERLRQMSMEVHAYLADAARSVGLGAVDLACIGIVRQAERDREPISAGRLGRRLGLSPAATTALLDRLSRHELVVRERSDQDARVVLVSLTDRARALGRQLFVSLNEEYARALDHDSATLDRFDSVLAELVQATERARDARATWANDRPSTDSS